MNPVSLAIVGCGDLTRRTILPHLALPDARALARVEAVCDVSPELCAHTARSFGISRQFTDFQLLLDQCEVEAVLVVVPPAFHGQYAQLAAQSGRHVYVQKPLAPTVEECDTLLQAVAHAGVKLVCAPHLGLWPLYAQIRALLDGGELGPVYNAFGPLLGWGGLELTHPTDPTWCFSPGSGPLRDHGVYGLTALVAMLGAVRRVGAMGNIRAPTRSWQGQNFAVKELDNLALLLEFGSGALAMLGESWCSTTDDAATFRIHALEGTIEGRADFAGYHGIFPLGAKITSSANPPRWLNVERAAVAFLDGEHEALPNPHIWADIRHLCQSIRGQTEFQPSGPIARHVVEILEAAHQAARGEGFVNLSTSL